MSEARGALGGRSPLRTCWSSPPSPMTAIEPRPIACRRRLRRYEACRHQGFRLPLRVAAKGSRLGARPGCFMSRRPAQLYNRELARICQAKNGFEVDDGVNDVLFCLALPSGGFPCHSVFPASLSPPPIIPDSELHMTALPRVSPVSGEATRMRRWWGLCRSGGRSCKNVSSA